MRAALLVAVLASLVASGVGCGGNAAVKSARRDLVGGDARAAFARLEAEARESDDTDVLLALAEVAARVERDSVAHRALARVEARGEDERERAAETRGRIWRALFGSAQAVIDTLEHAIGEDRGRAASLLARAEWYDPGLPATVASSGTLALAEGEIARSDSLFALAVERASAETAAMRPVVTALVQAAGAHARAGRLERAVALGRETVALAPDDPRARFDLGVNLHGLAEASGDAPGRDAWYREAIEQFSAVLELVPRDVDAGYNLALSHYRLGEEAAAREVLVELMPQAFADARVHRLAARLALAANDRARARAHVVAMRALEGGTDAPPTSALLVSRTAGRAGAKVYALVGRPQAIHSYTERSGSSVEVWLYPELGRLYGFSGGKQVASLEWSPPS